MDGHISCASKGWLQLWRRLGAVIVVLLALAWLPAQAAADPGDQGGTVVADAPATTTDTPATAPGDPTTTPTDEPTTPTDEPTTPPVDIPPVDIPPVDIPPVDIPPADVP